MIIKSLTSKTPRFGQLLNYLTKDKTKLFNPQKEQFQLRFNLTNTDTRFMAKEFIKNESNRLHKRKNNIKMCHEIISFSDLDREKITTEILKDIVLEYLHQRSPFIQAYAVGHFDQEHYHVHIVSSPVELYTGRNLRMSKSQFAGLKREIQAYQQEKYPELSNSIVRHGKKKELGKELSQPKEKEYHLDHSPHRKSDKATAKETIEYCLAMSSSKKEFYDLLKESGYTPYKRGSDFKGVSDGNRKFRFATLVKDYAERMQGLEQKRERLTEIREVRRGKEREHERDILHRQDYFE